MSPIDDIHRMAPGILSSCEAAANDMLSVGRGGQCERWWDEGLMKMAGEADSKDGGRG